MNTPPADITPKMRMGVRSDRLSESTPVMVVTVVTKMASPVFS